MVTWIGYIHTYIHHFKIAIAIMPVIITMIKLILIEINYKTD